jgi:ketosteroid isomerase-like protein
MTTNDQMRHVYETWHRASVGRDLDKLMALYANESVLDSSAVLVLEKDPSGIIRGHDRIRKHFASFFAMLGSAFRVLAPGPLACFLPSILARSR